MNVRNYLVIAEYDPAKTVHTQDRHVFSVQYSRAKKDYLFKGLPDTNDANNVLLLHHDDIKLRRTIAKFISLRIVVWTEHQLREDGKTL